MVLISVKRKELLEEGEMKGKILKRMQGCNIRDDVTVEVRYEGRYRRKKERCVIFPYKTGNSQRGKKM